MSPYVATAEVFMTALRAMPAKEQNTFLVRLVKDAEFREDIMDLALAVKRSKEKSQPLRGFLKSIKK